jgi:hypothetical protein
MYKKVIKMNISKLVNDKKDVKFNDIPLEWRDSFNSYMFGSTIYSDNQGNSIAYYNDFIRWYYENQKELDREIKINDILDNE